MGQEHAGWDRAIIPFGARRAEIYRLSGDLTAAIRLSRQIGVRLRGRTVHAGPCLGELAHAYALSGDVAAARATLDLAEELVLRVSLHVEPPLRAAETWILAAQGNIEGAVASALEAADAVEGLPRYELFALFDVVRLGSPSLVVDRLSRLAARSDGLLFRLCARYAEGGPSELEIVSKAFEDLGFLIHAAEASAQAAEGYRDLGRTRAQRAAGSRAVALARRCPGARIPALASLATPELTPRQREIAQLAASGLSNRQIAELLVISTRTVANTLVSAYEKLGVHDRAGLALILNDTI
jgi:DNA-binding CsgD family transcriptional regulator